MTIIEATPTSTLAGPEAFRAAHATPRHDLSTEPWIPVVRLDGARDDIGLAELFAEAHTIADLGEPDPLVRAAMRRYLTALTARLVLLDGTPDKASWMRRLTALSGFTHDEVAALMLDQAAHLWLYHPDTPFLQDSRLASPGIPFNKNWETSSDELETPLPGATSRAWAFKAGDPGVDAGLTWQRAARVLVARWYYGLLGNGGGGDMGGAFPNGTADAPLTHAFRVDPTGLFGTLLRNLAASVVALSASPTRGLAWADAHRPSPGGDGLYLYSSTATACLLGPAEAGQVIRRVLRGNVDDPPGSKETRKDAKLAAREADPHRIRRSPDAKGKSRSDVRVSAGEPPLRRLHVLRRGMIESDSGASHGVVREADLWLSGAERRWNEGVELTLANLAGSATSPQWAASATVSVPSAYLDPEWERSTDLTAMIDVGFGDRGVYPTLRLAIGRVFRGQEDPKKSVVGAALAARAHQLWLVEADSIIAAGLVGDLTVDEAETGLWRTGRDAVREVLAPYSSTSRYAGRVVQAIAAVRSPR